MVENLDIPEGYLTPIPPEIIVSRPASWLEAHIMGTF